MQPPSTRMNARVMPCVLIAATPNRSPVHFGGLGGSNGAGLLLEVMPARASAVSACRPSDARSRSTMWVSALPPAMPIPRPASVAERMRALSTIRRP